MILQCREFDFAIAEVTVVVAVGEPRCEFSQISSSDRLTAQGTEGLLPGRPAVHQYEFHFPSPNGEQSKGRLIRSNVWARLNSVGSRRSIASSQTGKPSSTIEIADCSAFLAPTLWWRLVQHKH